MRCVSWCKTSSIHWNYLALGGSGPYDEAHKTKPFQPLNLNPNPSKAAEALMPTCNSRDTCASFLSKSCFVSSAAGRARHRGISLFPKIRGTALGGPCNSEFSIFWFKMGRHGSSIWAYSTTCSYLCKG